MARALITGITGQDGRHLAEFLHTEDTILYAAAFDANGGVFEPLLGEEDAIISDSLNHASIIDGVRLCKAQRYRYANNDLADLEKQLQEARAKGSNIVIERDPAKAVNGADLVVTDTWVSMGQDHAHNKIAAMFPFQVNDALMGKAKADAKFLHCLPAHRGEEATDSVLDGPQSVIWDEAENRIHAQKSILLWSFGLLA